MTKQLDQQILCYKVQQQSRVSSGVSGSAPVSSLVWLAMIHWLLPGPAGPARTWIFVFSIISQLCLWENWIGLLDFTAISSSVFFLDLRCHGPFSTSEIEIKSVQSRDLIWFQLQIPREWNESLEVSFYAQLVVEREHLENISAGGIRSLRWFHYAEKEGQCSIFLCDQKSE